MDELSKRFSFPELSQDSGEQLESNELVWKLLLERHRHKPACFRDPGETLLSKAF